MHDMGFKEIEKRIDTGSWYYFHPKGRAPSGLHCHGLNENGTKVYEDTGELPYPCDHCYKALIHWGEDYAERGESYTEENVANFMKMLETLPMTYGGKFNRSVVVFYFWDKNALLDFVKLLEEKIKQFRVKGRIDWRYSCQYYQDLKPELWKSDKVFMGPKPKK